MGAGARRAAGGFLGDLSTTSQLYLVDRGVRSELEGVSKLSLGDPEWEQLTAAKVVDLVRYGLMDEAEKALAERAARSPDGPLFLAEAQLAAARLDWPRARACAEDAQRAAMRTNDPRRLETALLLSAGAATKQLDAADAARIAERAEEVVRTNSTRPPGCWATGEGVDREPAGVAPDASVGLPDIRRQGGGHGARGESPSAGWPDPVRDYRLARVIEQVEHGATRRRGDWLRELDLPIFGVNDGPSDSNRAS